MSTKKILIIDDDPDIVKYLEKLFQNNGYETLVAYDGLEAGDVAREQKPDLITLDLEMPKDWGGRFYRKLTKHKGFEDIPVVVISGLPGRDHSMKKAVGYFKKPFDPEELMGVVEGAIGAPTTA